MCSDESAKSVGLFLLRSMLRLRQYALAPQNPFANDLNFRDPSQYPTSQPFLGTQVSRGSVLAAAFRTPWKMMRPNGVCPSLITLGSKTSPAAKASTVLPCQRNQQRVGNRSGKDRIHVKAGGTESSGMKKTEKDCAIGDTHRKRGSKPSIDPAFMHETTHHD